MKKRQNTRVPCARAPWPWAVVVVVVEPGTGCDDRECPEAGEHDEHVRWLRGSGGHGGLARRARGSRAFRTFVPPIRVRPGFGAPPPHQRGQGRKAGTGRDHGRGMLSL